MAVRRWKEVAGQTEMSNMESSNTTTNNSLNGSTVTSSPAVTTSPTSGGLTWDEVENYWIQSGGNPQAASMAAAVADASSGLDASVTRTNPDGSTSVGLWLIPKNGIPPGTTDPVANARAAVQLSRGGTDWSQWCVTWSDNNCGQDGGTYLGSGSNALESLASQGGSYTLPGSAATGSGTSASTAGTAGTATTTKSSSKSYLLLALIIIVILGVIWFISRQREEGPEQSQARSQEGWSPAEEAQLSSDISDKELSQQTGRSIRAIRVRRNQMKSR